VIAGDIRAAFQTPRGLFRRLALAARQV